MARIIKKIKKIVQKLKALPRLKLQGNLKKERAFERGLPHSKLRGSQKKERSFEQGLPKKRRDTAVVRKRKLTTKASQAMPRKKAIAPDETKYDELAGAQTAAARGMNVSRIERQELPKEYGKDIIILQVRDPWWLHTYWEVREATLEKLKQKFLTLFDSARKVLRVYDVSFINFNGSNAHRYFDIELTRDANSWYIDTAGAGRSWCVDLGLKLADNRFITIVRSNIVTTPLEGPSWITDEEWAVPDELFAKLYTSAVGLGGSPVKIKKPWLELQKRQFASGGISSVGISPVKRREELKRKFWLIVNTELIVYGATEPDAKVSICGKPISLRADGTFSLRFTLPDGKQVIPVHAKSYDGIDERTITPVVTKETK